MLVSVLSSATNWGETEPSAEYVMGRISSEGAEAFFAAVFIALVSALFRIVRRPGKKQLTFALVFVIAICSLYSGLWGLNEFFPAEGDGFAMGANIERNMVLHGEGVFIWAGDEGKDAEEGRVPAGPIVIMRRKDGAGNFRIYAEGHPGAKPRTLVLSGGEEISLAANRATELPTVLRFFIDDLVYITGIVRPRALVDIPALLCVFSFVFFGFSLWATAKLSRWPLFNMWFTIAALWFVFSGTRFLGVFVVPELTLFDNIADIVPWLPAAFPGFCGLVLFLGGLLSKPLEEWRREMRYE
ncbi:MAG: hypothetical protein FWG35_07880 [Spirochaetaceae bacterium]|nr:hypothetical protein [Spirochaetaceae bacterium]